MMTSKEREENFRIDLAELLKKHSAEMEITDDRKPTAGKYCYVYRLSK